ncbi:MAG: hypothetical protein Q8R81_15345 [Novosphingobium sp.]|uniref:hypothetical protein n=1 Tax=Novosphingobium sp. TaxID=1874826 RepID=UPI002733B9B8|nr:hypothetical protein [Novosphingobium sp.]MDP3551755.1 hypothetical protein [Novosphingobium sp.]
MLPPIPPIWCRLPPETRVETTRRLIGATLAVHNQAAAGQPVSNELARLYKAIAEALEEADRLELRMVGIHLCNALHSLDEELEQG